MKIPGGPNLRTALFSSLAAASTLLFPCVEVYLKNRDYFALSSGSAFLYALFGFFFCFAVCFVILFLFGATRFFPAANSLFLGGAVGLLLQYLCWSGLFPEQVFEGDFAFFMLFLIVFHLLFLFLPVLLAFFFRRALCRHGGRIALVIVLTQIVSAACAERESTENNYDFVSYTISDAAKFQFAKGENIIVLVVDAMGERLCKRTMEKYPELKTLFRDFTCFDRMTSPIPRTMYAVPSMLTGEEFSGKVGEAGEGEHAEYLKRACRRKNSLFQALRRAGFRVEGYPFMLQTISYSPEVIDNSLPITRKAQKQSAVLVLDTVLSKLIPFFLKPLLSESYFRATDRFVTPCDRGEAPFSDIPYDITFHRVLSRDFSVGDREKVFKYLHVNGAHDPVRTDENLDYDSASGKVRQLRGSLKIVELLFGKLKEAGLYDRATIVVLGDHTEFYTPEVLAFIKRRGESHPFLRYNSVPCRVSDIAGTVLKETYPVPGLKSLFDLRSVPGNGKCRESVRFENVPFSPWKKVSSMPAPGKLFPYSKSYSAEDGKRLVISPDCEEYETPLEFSLFVKDIASENIWESHSLPHRKEEVRGYLISQDLTLPDGIYQVILQTSVPGLAGTEFQALPRYLQSSRGKIAFSRQSSAVSSRAMLPGETIRFRPLQYVPQIVFSRDVSFGENYVVLGRDQCVGIHLPALESPAELEWKMQGPLLQEGGTLSLLEKDTVLAKIAVKDPRDLAVSVTVPPGKERILFFRFEFAVPRRERDIRAISPTLRLFSISLRPRAGAEKR